MTAVCTGEWWFVLMCLDNISLINLWFFADFDMKHAARYN